MKRGQALSVAVSVVVASRAQAFEREWHTGGGLGVTVYPHYYSVGPSIGLNGAYGISDAFDLKLELLGSFHDYTASSPSPTQHAEPLSIVGGLSYKLDVLQWIPYGAVLVGYQHVAGALPVGKPFRRDDLLGAVVLGLDYEMTRNLGLGGSIRVQMPLSSPSQGEAVTMMLRAEYHWGF
jgi:hypothetical protein